MPDLTTEYAWNCESNQSWFTNVKGSRPGTMHTVTWGRLYGLQQCQYGYTCTCTGFQFRGTCKHVKAEEDRDRAADQGPEARCGWDGRFELPEVAHDASGEPCCPSCSGPVFSYAYGA